MGLAVDLFSDPNISDEFLCTICQDVLQEPAMLDPCEHVFCKACIEQWQEEADTCPVDRQHIQGHRKPPRIFLNLLNALQLQCPFKQLGCNVMLTLGDLFDHDRRCEHNPDNRQECAGGCGQIATKAQRAAAAGGHSCVAFLKDQLEGRKQALRVAEEELARYRTRYGPLPPSPPVSAATTPPSAAAAGGPARQPAVSHFGLAAPYPSPRNTHATTTTGTGAPARSALDHIRELRAGSAARGGRTRVPVTAPASSAAITRAQQVPGNAIRRSEIASTNRRT